VDCQRAATANLPFGISPGICIYQCLDGQICVCVLLGNATSAICVFTFCSSGAQASTEQDYDAITERALAAYEEQQGQQPEEQNASPTMQAQLEVGQPGDTYEQEAERISEQVVNASTLMIVSHAY
jgi:hypothetical protein